MPTEANDAATSLDSKTYLGNSKRKEWKAQVKVNHHNIHSGYFDSPIDADRAVNAAYRKYFPEVEIPNPEAE